MPDPFPVLFSPLRIGGVTIKNRVVSSGHDTVMAAGGWSATSWSPTTPPGPRAASA